jgi:hypothetical protein
MYILIFLKLLLIKTIPVYFINIIVTKVFLPKPLKKYINIFLINETERLFIYKNYNYIINLNGDKSFYKLLYKLLIIKLTQLRNYLNDALIKNQIRYFINFTGAFIFFFFLKTAR